MDIRTQITIRTKKLGVLIRDARLAARRSPRECAEAIGIKSSMLKAYEEGRRAPSLPELEVLVYYLKLPIRHFWGHDVISDDTTPVEPVDLPKLMSVRQRLIGVLLRQERNKANLSLKNLSEATGISTARLKAYEMGERPIPVPELESVIEVFGIRVEEFFDKNGPVGKWMTDQKGMEKFLELPEEMRNFICQPVNRPYLELAMKMSEMSKDRLRSVAEGLLDITL
ncbi:MAG TPA: helix-turn-helix transcriptional regulator [Anaerolineales bacterium]|nr:helix-turn-helix transcriptional regulator [Anaerolineales bacterium]